MALVNSLMAALDGLFDRFVVFFVASFLLALCRFF
jgi:hypothetical protein